ncbi:hypothetical protein Cme02nite_51770 [Catellatospora methionotrophica]|uniref:Uncharacterized protein n=1 Tax=Catellatospora methionotrophica TaxID=121620 RepID=A0A8J3LQ61_9ACTN|nr:hypothetical protein [Catellatospora methionotrophica]GIG16845.1 hypothetical protein Cme02nite_51770 [Catellatospora methionotrophica]
MRRVLTTAVLGLSLLGAAACAADPAPSAAAPSSAAASAAASSAAPAAATGTKDKAGTCAAFNELAFSPKGLAVLGATGKIIGAALGDEAKAKEQIPLLGKAIEEYRAELVKISADTADAELKAALEADLAMVAAGGQAVAAANGDLNKIIEVLESTALDFETGRTARICQA